MLKSHGKYSVNIASDGAILVKKGDWISKYSAAIHKGDTSKIYEYGRMRGKILIPIRDPNKITTGEKIYHIPTYVLKTLEKPLKVIKEVIAEGKKIQGEINVLKSLRSYDLKEIERIEKKIERLSELSDDAAAECSDAYSCVGGGGASVFFNIKADSLRKKVREIQKKVRSKSKTIGELEKRLQENLQEQQELQKMVEDMRRILAN